MLASARFLRCAPRRRWQAALSGLAALSVAAVCGLGGFFLVTDEGQGNHAQAAPPAEPPSPAPRDISSRAVDPAPLTVAEVFPTRHIVIVPGEAPYSLLRSEAVDGCRTISTGAIADLLDELGCSQAVRGTLRSPDGNYLVTAGIVNLADAAAADWAHQKLKPLVDGRRGRFEGMRAGPGTAPVARSSAQVGWHVLGHYLAYCVLARADGGRIDEGDRYARRILFDMVEAHLREDVLRKRATVPFAGPVA